MKKLLLSLLLIISLFGLKAQTPSGVPTTFGKGWFRYGFVQDDSGHIFAKRDTSWTPRFVGTVVYWENPGVDSSLWIAKKLIGQKWYKITSNSTSGGGSTTLPEAYANGNRFDSNATMNMAGYGYYIDSANFVQINNLAGNAVFDVLSDGELRSFRNADIKLFSDAKGKFEVNTTNLSNTFENRLTITEDLDTAEFKIDKSIVYILSKPRNVTNLLKLAIDTTTGEVGIDRSTSGSGTVTSVATTNGYAMLSSVSNPTLAANILLSVDSAALSAKYLRRADSTLYVTQKKLNDTAAAIRANMGSGTDSASYHTTTQITDSSFSLNRPNGTSDTIVIAGTDTSSLSNRINLKLNISDTSSMLSAYRTAINTNTSNIALKLNITDTVNIRPQLIAGTNVTITGTYPSLTIAASGGSSGWGLTGNAITAGQFIGTTNNTSFRLHSNNTLRILADSAGKVFIDSIYVGRGIGTKYNNVAIGDSALQRNTTGNGNTAIGDSALQLNTSGFDNTAIGNKAGRAITSNGGNTFVGSNAGLAVNSIGNTAVGNEALKAAAGNFNTALGFYALRANSGANNIAVGVNSLLSNTSGSGNVAVGYGTLAANLTGGYNVVIGNQAVSLGTGSYTTAVGAGTLTNLTTGVANLCFGYNTGWGITTGSYNVIIGGQVSALPGSRSNYVIINDGQGNAALTRDSLYRTGLGTITTPTALLHIAAGTTTIAPIKLTSGTNLTTPEAGTIEYNGTNLFFTPASAARNSVLITASVNTVSPTSPDRTITVVINGTTYYLAAKTTND